MLIRMHIVRMKSNPVLGRHLVGTSAVQARTTSHEYAYTTGSHRWPTLEINHFDTRMDLKVTRLYGRQTPLLLVVLDTAKR